jgi:peptide/nickel transport system permease protein
MVSRMRVGRCSRVTRGSQTIQELDQEARSQRLPANLLFGLIVFGTLVGCAILGLIWTPYNPNAQNFAAQLKPPSLAHLLGTDNFGRDIFSRLLRASSTSLLVGVISVGIGSSLGLLFGAISGYFGGLLDDFIMRVMDALSAFPTVLLALLMAAVFRPNLTTAMIAVGLASVPTFTRLTRAGVLSIKNLEYVDGARALGANEPRILARHILPNLASPIIVQATFAFGVAILAEAALSYLGIGTQPPNPSWGVMLRDAQTFIYSSPWPTVFPGVVIAITVLGLNLLGDGLRDRLDPRGR